MMHAISLCQSEIDVLNDELRPHVHYPWSVPHHDYSLGATLSGARYAFRVTGTEKEKLLDKYLMGRLLDMEAKIGEDVERFFPETKVPDGVLLRDVSLEWGLAQISFLFPNHPTYSHTIDDIERKLAVMYLQWWCLAVKPTPQMCYPDYREFYITDVIHLDDLKGALNVDWSDLINDSEITRFITVLPQNVTVGIECNSHLFRAISGNMYRLAEAVQKRSSLIKDDIHLVKWPETLELILSTMDL